MDAVDRPGPARLELSAGARVLAKLAKRIVSNGNGALAALDAAASTDPRENGVGDRFLTGVLKDFARG